MVLMNHYKKNVQIELKEKRRKVCCKKLNGYYALHAYLEHFEFCDREALTLLKGIAERAENVTFSMKDGLIRMSVFIGYFDEVY